MSAPDATGAPVVTVGPTSGARVASAARSTGRRRRPSGAAPPLPRSIGVTGRIWLVALVVAIAWMIVLMNISSARRVTDRADTSILQRFARVRTPWLTDVARTIDRVGSGWTVSIGAIATAVALLVLRRWRHLFTYFGAVAVLEIVGMTLYQRAARPRPYGVTTIGRWAGSSMPSPPLTISSAFLLTVAYTLVPAGRARTRAKLAIGLLLLVFAAARLYLAVDHPSDQLVGVSLSVAIMVVAYRVFTSNEVFPVVYRSGKTAHLDVTGRRGEAIRRAIADQLGLAVVDIKPVGLEGSGGSTPLRLRVAGEPDTYLFAKLYAMNHVRADRWYKLGRTILYGRLEDEAPFQSVRRLVEYEDYALRVMRDVGIRTAMPYGIVEITPEREYMIVTEFIAGASEIGEAPVDDGVIDDGLRLVRQLWDAGLAHRDIKPANLLVRDGQLVVIDVAFAQVRPSPWRQAVDLANMMLVLAVRTDARRVYEQALAFFTPDEIAEAFAATRGVASPTQLRAFMKRDGRDLVAEFRSLAPHRHRIALQRWSVRRVLLAAAVVLGGLFAVSNIRDLLEPAYDVEVTGTPTCGTGNLMVLVAQSVPSATMLPCVATLPAGLTFDHLSIRRDRTRLWLRSGTTGARVVEATVVASRECDVARAAPAPSDEVGVLRFDGPATPAPAAPMVRTYVFDGGCTIYRFLVSGPVPVALAAAADEALGFVPRATIVDHVRAASGLALCGAGATCRGADR